MQFKLSKSHRYWWPVRVRIPDPEQPGRIIEQQLKMQFEPLSREDMLEAQDAAAKISSLREMADHEAAQARRIVKNWEGVVDEAGAVVPFTPELLDQALGQSWFRKAVQDALAESMNGEEARRGN